MPIRIDLSTDREPVEVLAEDFIARHQAGEHPTIREYQEAYPELADEIAAVFPAILTLNQVNPNANDLDSGDGITTVDDQSQNHDREHEFIGEFRILREIGRGGMGVVYEAEQPSLGRRVALKLLPDQMSSSGSRKARFAREARAVAKMHHTNIVPVYNVGSDGALLYYTMQYIRGDSLDNVITVLRDNQGSEKALHGPECSENAAKGSVDSSDRTTIDLQQGQNQEQQTHSAQAMARGIAGSLCGPLSTRSESGSEKPQSEAKRETASIRITETHAGAHVSRRKVHDFYLNAARIGAEAADAIGYAHAQGILHRDIKPGNLLMDERGRVWLTDFGLARLDEEEGLTETGDIIGTLRYMAPEVFNGIHDVRNDVYSLGLTLYELVCLQPAFQESERHVLIRKVMAGETESVQKHRPDIPADLATIIQKATATVADNRYQTATELRDDLRRFLEDQPILARQLSTVERLQRWNRREPRLAKAVFAAVGATLIAIIGISYNWLAAVDARDDAIVAQAAERTEKERAQAAQIAAQKQRVKAEKSKLAEMEARQDAEAARDEQARLREDAELKAYTTRMALAQVSWENDDIQRTLDLLEAAKPTAGEVDRREWEWYYLHRLCNSELWKARGHSGTETAWCLDVSADGKRVATGGGGNLYFRHRGEVQPGEVILRDFDTGQELARLKGHGNQVRYVRLQPGGDQLVSVDYEGVAKLWDTSSLQEVGQLPPEFGPYALPEYSTDGSRLLLRGSSGRVCVFQTDRIADPTIIAANAGPVDSAAFSPDGQQIISIASGKSIDGDAQGWGPTVWSAESGEKLFQFESPRNISIRSAPFPNLIRWTPDGLKIVAGISGGNLCVWDAVSRKWERSLQVAETRTINGLECSPDSRYVVCGTDVSTVFVIDILLGTVAAEHKGHVDSIRQAAFDSEGARVASIDVSGTVKVWDNTRQQTHVERQTGFHPLELRFSADSQDLHVLSMDGLSKYDVSKGVLSSGLPDNRVQHISPLDIQFPRADGVISPSGGWAGMPRESWFDIVRLKDGQPIRRIDLQTEAVHSAALDPKQNTLALFTRRYHEFGSPRSEERRTRLRLYDAQTFEFISFVDLPREISGTELGCRNCRFNSDGTLLAATINGIADGSEIIIIDVAKKRLADRIRVESSQTKNGGVQPYLIEVDFHPTLPRVAVVDAENNELSSWTLSRNKQDSMALQHQLDFRVTTIQAPLSIAYSPVGHRIAVASQPGRVQLLDARSGDDLLLLKTQKKRTTGGTNIRVRFSPDGQSLTRFEPGGKTVFWGTQEPSAEIRRQIWRAGLPSWRQEVLQESLVSSTPGTSIHLDRLVAPYSETNAQKAAVYWYEGSALMSSPTRFAGAATSFAQTFDETKDWRVAAKAAALYFRTGKAEKGYQMIRRAAAVRFAEDSTHPLSGIVTFDHHERHEHFLFAHHVADCLDEERNDLLDKFGSDILHSLDPTNPIHVAVASLVIYHNPKQSGFDWETGLATIRSFGVYPGINDRMLRRQPRELFLCLMGRLYLLNGDPKEAIPFFDLIIQGDVAYESATAQQVRGKPKQYLVAGIVHEKVEARLLKAIALRHLGNPDAAANEVARATADWNSVAEQTAKFTPADELMWCRIAFIKSLLNR